MFDLTIPQQNIWNLQRFYEGTSISNNCGAIFFEKKCDHRLLNKAINKLIELQSGMRLRFREENGQPMQYVSEHHEEKFSSEYFENKEIFEIFANQYALTPFELIDSPMYRFVVFDLEEKSGVLLCTNHLISDAWAISMIANIVYDWYVALEAGETPEQKEYGYISFIESEKAYFQSVRYEKDQRYWSEQYSDRPEISSIKPNSTSVVIPTAKRHTTKVSEILSTSIDNFYLSKGISQAVLFEAALVVYLSRINPENSSVSLGIPVLNRSGAAEKNAVGMCISTTVLTVPVSKEKTAMELCQEINLRQFELFRHQRFPYSHILRNLHEKYEFSGNLYDVIVSFQNARTGAEARTQWFSNGYCEVGLEFHIDNRDNADCYTLNVDYQTELFPQDEEIELLVKRILFIIQQIIENPAVCLNEISILPLEEQKKLIYEFNKTEISFKRDKCVHELFVEQVEKSPDKTALVFENQRFTYQQLDEMTNSLAHYLRCKGVGPGAIVPIISKRSWHVIVAMMGILKAGGAYMPVDPTYPKERINYMIETAKCDLALTYGYFDELDIEAVSLENFDFSMNTMPVDNLNNSEDLCYIISTSGSTGKPKGVSLCHRNVVNYCNNNIHNNVCHSIIEDNNQSIVSVTNIIFDIFVTESLLPLLNGICIYFANDEQVFSQKKLAELISSNAIDVMQTTPTKMRSYIIDKLNVEYMRKLKLIILGGEALPVDLYMELRGYTDARIFNIYGPAETTVWSTNKCVEDMQITIGKPIANTQVYILGQNKEPLPIGVAGELCISGDGVGKGYLNRPELTAEKFIPNPFVPGTMMYCTGDLARWRDDGEIEYLGRIDTQVKIRGLRIELGEIESVMSSFDGIQLTAVTDKRDETGRQYLVGYYTAETKINEKELRFHLSAKLPKYMVPNYFMHLQEMPMTASGKTDRKNLPLPEFTEQERIYIAPETPTEQKIAKIWEELLNTVQIGKNDDFFELGGDSLIAIHLLTKLEVAFEVGITVKDIMEHSELEQLAVFMDNAEKATVQIPVVSAEKYELLPQQMAIYAAYRKDESSLTYNMPTRILLPKEIDRDKLKNCILHLSELHPELKTYICTMEGTPYAIIDESAQIVFEDCNNVQDFVRPFNLEKAPLVHVAFTEDSLLFDMHHIIADGESLNIILHDIAFLYQENIPANPTIGYSDYAAYFENVDFAEHKAYFKKMLKCDFEPMSLPEKKQKGIDCGVSKFYQIDHKTFEQGRKIARAHKMTDTMLFLGAFGILLSKYTGRMDVLSSIVLTNRSHKETEHVVGMFVNTLPVMLPVRGRIEEYFEHVRELVLNLFKYQEIPFLSIADAVGIQDKNVVNTSFVYQADGAKSLIIGDEKLTSEWIDTHTAKFDLSFELTPNDAGCAVRIEYNCGKFEEELIDRLFYAYVRIIEQLTKEQIADISVLSPEEYQKIVFDFNDTAMEYPKDKCVHELFMEQAAKTPDKIALIFEDKQFTYRQLDEMSNSLAHYLLQKGLEYNQVVGVLLARSELVIISQLAVLKAGGVFLPIDKRYPRERIEYLSSDCDVKFILTTDIDEFKMHSSVIDLCTLKWDYKNNTCVPNKFENPCYIIYTSGSTGKPKGCVLTHRGLANFCKNNNIISYCNSLPQQIAVSVNTISFDFFIAESLLPLVNGWTVVLANENQSDLKKDFSKLVCKASVNIIQTTPTRLKMYTKGEGIDSYFSTIDVVVTSGEALTPELLSTLKMLKIEKIFNPLGPSECSVWNLGGEFRNDITLGKPIANTQVYILGENKEPLPIGVAGELCISGDGVGKGYLNRPELTAEKFIPNPFVPGTMMYCTGDLARWRDDGEIEYLGRIDTQVKIRGLRIELGEIESVMSSFDGIQLTAVTDKRDETGRQYLVGYYTAETEINEKELRYHLSAKLPKYMVPNYFMHLQEMPMTASGKTDRKNLPLPEFKAVEREYVVPETTQEIILCNVLTELFQMEQIGVTDDFFELGGDSLRAIEYVAKAHNEGVSFTLQNVFDYPTIRQLCDYLNGGSKERVEYSEEEFVKYQELLSKNIIDDSYIPERKSVGNVFLTGATGFLGSHIVDQFMKAETGKIYCLVRGGQERLSKVMEYYFDSAYADEIGKRIVAVEGDITNENLAEVLPDDIQTVIHTAATVKHYGSYEYFHCVNVQGTKNVIAYAQHVNAKLIHISTLSVSGNSLVDAFDIYRAEETMKFAETSLYIGQPLDNVYIHSKFEAERAVLDAALDGLDTKIIRVGNLTNRVSDFKFQPNYKSNAFLTRVKAALELGCLPDYLLPLYSEFSPIDLTAEGVIKIAQYADKQTVFHLNNNHGLYFDKMIDYLRALNIKIEVVDGDVFNHTLHQLAKSENTEYIYEAFQNDMDESGELVYDSNIHILNDFTVWFMNKLGFEWNEIGADYVNGYVNYFRNLGYLEV